MKVFNNNCKILHGNLEVLNDDLKNITLIFIVCCRLMVSHKFLVFTYGCSIHPNIDILWIFFKGGYSSIGRTTVCGTVSSLFNSGYPP